MSKNIEYSMNNMEKSADKAKYIEFLSENEVKKARNFHKSFPEYKETPLVKLDNLAKEIGVKNLFLKDESYRFGLNAFKVLGGSYAMAKHLAELLDKDIDELGYKELTSDEVREKLGEITFYTATDGNHGRGVAWTAKQLKQKSVVYMPIGSSEYRLEKIRGEGAEASITDLNYDDAVRLANEDAEKNGGLMVQDTAWEGYEKIPAWIMQGYSTMAYEAIEQLKEYGVEKPTHVFVQAGVGSLAGAVQGLYASYYGDDCPKTIVVESDLAHCLYKSAKIGDGAAYAVGGEMQTLMAGLACGEANTISWEILKNYTDAFVSCPDWVSANGMRILASPIKGDEKVTAGESGAVSTGLIYEIMTNLNYKKLKEDLKLDENSKILVFSTEGDTDPSIYRDVIWFGRNEK